VGPILAWLSHCIDKEAKAQRVCAIFPSEQNKVEAEFVINLDEAQKSCLEVSSKLYVLWV